jgi:hypothetical protein
MSIKTHTINVADFTAWMDDRNKAWVAYASSVGPKTHKELAVNPHKVFRVSVNYVPVYYDDINLAVAAYNEAP